ncbi:MAG: monovalent cation/H+ antiporter complex subunit F [Bacillota bacterium]|nr:monovalent cation/H+ antiporter complex subunit F [Bacillota bacterium]
MSGMVELLMQNDILTAGIVLIASGLLLIYRIARGPHPVDRLLAAFCIEVLIGLVLILMGCYEDKSLFSDLGFIVILLCFIEGILLSKFLEGRL